MGQEGMKVACCVPDRGVKQEQWEGKRRGEQRVCNGNGGVGEGMTGGVVEAVKLGDAR